MAKPNLMVMVTDLYRRRRQRQALRRLRSLPPEPQRHLEIAFMSARHNFLHASSTNTFYSFFLHSKKVLKNPRSLRNMAVSFKYDTFRGKIEHFFAFLPPEGEVLDCLGRTLLTYC